MLSGSQQVEQTSAPLLPSSSVSGSQLTEREKHSSMQHKRLIILLKMFSSNSSLIQPRHISGGHPPITRDKRNRALKVTKNKLPIKRGKHRYIFSKKQDGKGFVSLHLMSMLRKKKALKLFWGLGFFPPFSI